MCSPNFYLSAQVSSEIVLQGCQQRVCVLVLFYALGGVRLCTRVCRTLKWQVLKELPDGCVLRGRLPRLMIMKN